jgi:glycogen synthase
LSWWQAIHGVEAPPQWDAYREAVSVGLQAADLVVAPSQSMLHAVQDYYGPLLNAWVIPNGRRLMIQPCEKETFILSAGRLWDPAKNVQVLAQVAADLPWRIYVAGETRCPNGQETIMDQVRPLGRLTFKSLGHWMARASIYAAPARYEPFGLSTLEAGLAGCALVLGDIPSYREIWEDSAFYVPPEDPHEWRRSLQQLTNDTAQLAEFSSRARRRAAFYTPERMADAYLSAYQSIQHKSNERVTACAL